MSDEIQTTTVSPDPRIAAVQRYLQDERGAGRWIFHLPGAEIARLLAVADGATEAERVWQITRELANG